jgi:uncharacterized repeat protein (TIGR03803 family)
MADLSSWRRACTVFLLCAATATAAQAQTFTTLVTFDAANGANPYMSFVQGIDGNFYGTTSSGGANCAPQGCGTVFKITASGALTTLYSFCSQSGCTDGVAPNAGLVLGLDGDFYGTTSAGGNDDGGTIFKITSAGALTTLYRFCSQLHCIDGERPQGSLIQGPDGNFYGTAFLGGRRVCFSRDYCGTVFKISPSGQLTTLRLFGGNGQGTNPTAALVLALDGHFYTTTEDGGACAGCGTIVEMTSTGKLKTLHDFCFQANCADGARPYAGLVQALDGNFYGATYVGGINGYNGYGTLFKMTPGGNLTTLYSFCAQTGCKDGGAQVAALVQATDGNLYGATEIGGDSNSCTLGCGTLYSITTTGTLMTLHSFDSTDGVGPAGALLQSTSGSFYGTTAGGADFSCYDPNGCGTVFNLDVGLGPFIAFVRFYGKVGQPLGMLGQGFTGTTSVSLNGTPATFTVVSDTFMRATVPLGATTGYVTVTTPSGTLTSNVPFRVIP